MDTVTVTLPTYLARAAASIAEAHADRCQGQAQGLERRGADEGASVRLWQAANMADRIACAMREAIEATAPATTQRAPRPMSGASVLDNGRDF